MSETNKLTKEEEKKIIICDRERSRHPLFDSACRRPRDECIDRQPWSEMLMHSIVVTIQNMQMPCHRQTLMRVSGEVRRQLNQPTCREGMQACFASIDRHGMAARA